MILLLETWILQSQQHELLLVLAPPSKLGVGSALTDMGLCCLKPFGFQAGKNSAWFQWRRFGVQVRVLLVGTRLFFLFTFSVELEAVGFDCPSKPGFQVEVTLLEIHRLPMGIARQCPQGCGPLLPLWHRFGAHVGAILRHLLWIWLEFLSRFQFPGRGDPTFGNLVFAISAALAAVGFGSPKQAGCRQCA